MKSYYLKKWGMRVLGLSLVWLDLWTGCYGLEISFRQWAWTKGFSERVRT